MNEGTDYVEVSTATPPQAFLEAVTTTLRAAIEKTPARGV
jgi:hypothetical protein